MKSFVTVLDGKEVLHEYKRELNRQLIVLADYGVVEAMLERIQRELQPTT